MASAFSRRQERAHNRHGQAAAMNLALWLHLVHVAAATVWVGGGVTLSVIGIRVRRNADPPVIRDFAHLLSRLLPKPRRLAAHARGDTPDDAPRRTTPAGRRPTVSI